MGTVIAVKPPNGEGPAEGTSVQDVPLGTAPNRFAYYVVAAYTAQGGGINGTIQGHVSQEVVTDNPLVAGAQVQAIGAHLASIIKPRGMANNGGLLLTKPTVVAVVLNFVFLRAWFDPNPQQEDHPPAAAAPANGNGD